MSFWVNQSFNEFTHKHKSLTHSATMQSHTNTERMIWHVLAPWLKRIALTCTSPIRACADCSSLLETRDGGTGGAGVPFAGKVTLWWSHGRAAGSCSPGEVPAPLSSPLLPGQTGWINHLQRCQHLPKQFQIGINGRWGCCSLCLISSTKCGFISYKMKPSVARRCKDQVREDGGRGWQRERREMCVCVQCPHAYVHVYVHVYVFCVYVCVLCVCGVEWSDGGQGERWNTVKQKQNSGSEIRKKREALIH